MVILPVLRDICYPFTHISMMTSSNGNIFRVTGPRSPVNSPQKGQWCGALMFSLICVWINDWVNNRDASDLRRYRAHYDVIVMHFSDVIISAKCEHANIMFRFFLHLRGLKGLNAFYQRPRKIQYLFQAEVQGGLVGAQRIYSNKRLDDATISIGVFRGLACAR